MTYCKKKIDNHQKEAKITLSKNDFSKFIAILLYHNDELSFYLISYICLHWAVSSVG